MKRMMVRRRMNETNERAELYIRNRDVLSYMKWEKKQVGRITLMLVEYVISFSLLFLLITHLFICTNLYILWENSHL